MKKQKSLASVLATAKVRSPLWGGLGWGVVPHSETEKEESSFSEEKEAKRLLFWRPRQDPGHGLDLGRGGDIKVFCFFSSEKKGFFQFGALLERETPHHNGEGEAGRLLFLQKRRKTPLS